MNFRTATSCLAALIVLGLMPAAAMAQSVTVDGSPLPDQPYTLIYPDVMVASGELGGPQTISHPDVPVQCVLTVVGVEDLEWSAEVALAELDDAAVTAGWGQTLPGFALTSKATTPYQSNTALSYEGTSTGSSESAPLTLVHTETVDADNGYTLDCLYATEAAEQARPIVDFIIANFSTQQDAEPIAAR